MRKRVYIETSVVGVYFEDRTDVVSVAQRYWTRRWWEEEKATYAVFCSEAVVNELAHPDYPHSEEALGLVAGVARLEIEEAVSDVARVYIEKGVMPRDPLGDALHLALASYHKCDFLLTWNCNHIANPNKFGRIRILNTSLGVSVPALVTPNQLTGGVDD